MDASDSVYQRLNTFVQRRPPDKVHRTLRDANTYLEKVVGIACANQHRALALFAIVAFCCLHIYQVHIPMFALAVAALFCTAGVQLLLMKIAGTYLAALMVYHDIEPIFYSDVGLVKLKLGPDHKEFESAMEKKLILNSMLTLLIIFLSCAMHKIPLISGFRMCVLFPDISRTDADKGALEFFKYMFNFFFYKFGVELCWFAIALQLCLGINAFDICLCILLWLTLVSRKTVHTFWPFVRAQVGIYMIFKYMIEASGEPVHSYTSQRETYLTSFIESFKPDGDLHKYISGFGIMGNYCVVLMISRQMWIFNGNWSRHGGTNDEIWQNFDDPDLKNEVKDFLLRQDTWLDVMKNMLLPNFPFVSLVLILFSSMASPNLFSLGYIVGASSLLILGPSKLFMRNIKRTRSWFQYLLAYNLLVISAKFVLCTMVEQISITAPVLRVIFMDWTLLDQNLTTPLDPQDLVDKLASNFYFDAIFLGLLLLIRRFIESHYFLHFRRDYRARDFLDEWGIYLQCKGAEMQLKKKTDFIEELKRLVVIRLAKEDASASMPPLKNANMNRVVEIPDSVSEKKLPYGLTIWLWSTTLVFRFVDFGFQQRLRLVKEERQFYRMENKTEPTEEHLEQLWQQFESDNLDTILWKPRPIQLLQAFWTCLRAHSHLLCFLAVFHLQAFCYCSFYTLPLPLSVLYASKKYPRPHNYYWNTLLVYCLLVIIAKLGFASYLGEGIIARLGGPTAFWETTLFILIIWHRSILNSMGLWYQPLCYQIKPKRVAFVDVYACILVIQVVCIFIILANFSSFAAESKGADSVVDLDSDSVPVTFFIVTFLHLLGMTLDRIFYVSRAFACRKVYHTIVYLALHIWLFHFVPKYTHTRFGTKFSQQLYYFLQCIYLLLSAYQVRTCHSRCSAVSILCQSFSRINWVLFMIYSNIPFVEAVRRSIDFFFTKTLLLREEFVIIESIFDLVFQVKCERVNEFKYMTNRTFRKRVKTVIGLITILGMVAFIAAPLIFFSMEDSMTKHNHMKFLSLELRSPILGQMYYQRTTQFQHISPQAYALMKNHFAHHRGALTFLNEFGHEDVFVAQMPQVSLSEWDTFETREEIAKKLRAVRRIRPTIKWAAEREFEGDEDFNDHTSFLERPPENSTLVNPLAQLADMVEKGGNAPPVWFPDLMTKFIVFHRTDPSSNAKILMLTRAKDPTVDDLLVSLVRLNDTDKFAWQVSENCFTPEYRRHTSRLPHASKNCENLDIYIFSAHPPLFGFTKNIGGLIGMYVGVILTLWKYLSKMWRRDAFEVVYEEMVCPDKLLQLCLDVYQCRITQQAEMELNLGQKLISIFSTPSEFEKWTQGEVGVDPRADFGQ